MQDARKRLEIIFRLSVISTSARARTHTHTKDVRHIVDIKNVSKNDTHYQKTNTL